MSTITTRRANLHTREYDVLEDGQLIGYLYRRDLPAYCGRQTQWCAVRSDNPRAAGAPTEPQQVMATSQTKNRLLQKLRGERSARDPW